MSDLQPAPTQHPIAGKLPVTTIWWQWFQQAVASFLGGSGTAGYITKWSDSNTLANSVFTEEKLRARVRNYDQIVYTTSNNNITQILYKRASITEMTEARTYNAYGHIATRTFTGDLAETWTYSYDTDNFTVTGITVL